VFPAAPGIQAALVETVGRDHFRVDRYEFTDQHGQQRFVAVPLGTMWPGEALMELVAELGECVCDAHRREPFSVTVPGSHLDEILSALNARVMPALEVQFHQLNTPQKFARLDALMQLREQKNPSVRLRGNGRGVEVDELWDRMFRTYVVRFPMGIDPVGVRDLLADDPAVVRAGVSEVVRVDWLPSDLWFTASAAFVGITDGSLKAQWPLFRINALPAWQLTRGAGVRIAVVDTGVDAAHGDLAPNIYLNPLEHFDAADNDGNGIVDDVFGWDFWAGAGDAICVHPQFGPNKGYACDLGRHGSHVAGLAAAAANSNGYGMVGAAPEAKIFHIRAHNEFGNTTHGKLGQAMNYATLEGMDVVNASFRVASGSSVDFQFIRSVAESQYFSGMVLVAAAGNTGGPIPQDIYLANQGFPIVVGANDRYGARTDLSSTGPTVDVVAPGGDSALPWEQCTLPVYGTAPVLPNDTTSILSVRSTTGIPLVFPIPFADGFADYDGCPFRLSKRILGDWVMNRGTSMATPLVSAAAALLLSRKPTLSPSAVEWYITRSAVDRGPPGKDSDYGWGELNLGNMLYRPLEIVASEDAWVEKQNPTANHGGALSLRAKSSQTSDAKQIFVKFFVPNLPHARHQGALLRFFVEDRSASPTDAGELWKTAASWSEYRVTWKNRPTGGTYIGKVAEPYFNVARPGGEVAVDVSAFVRQGWNSFAIRPAKGYSRIASRESSLPKPTLVVMRCGDPAGCGTCDGAQSFSAAGVASFYGVSLAPLVALLVDRLRWRRRRRPRCRS